MIVRFLFALAVVAGASAADTRPRPTRPAAESTAPATYKGAIVMEAASGAVIFEDRADTLSPPASMTKLMTFAVLHDHLLAGKIALTTPVRITPEDSKIGGTQVYLDPRETFPVEELIHAMMIQSANDAAHALARAAAGSVPAFVELMNAKARALGMEQTTFRTPHGLPPANRRLAEGDLTTPRDFALLSRYLVERTDALKYTSIRARKFGEGLRAQPIDMVNHNKLVGKLAGVDGLKTGFTNGAGFCLAATAQRNGRRIIVVTMGSAQSKERDLQITELIERGFRALPAAAPTLPIAQEPRRAPVLTAPAPAAPAPAPAEPVIKFALPKSGKP